ncbi:SusC/RagA family TonB-linked outer membrane protein [Echinicola pacifica]|uniref:SusC/RagA family TonB-linked outer membrane protein n=1 Tax=Echinicola pacifica TaxID=346377 RepID=A0A918UVQ2_9BACT|nr:TonB-dependent receptor [Echinicola pacifica]GGZ37623.1 SusC/RagA family TonB-linked outer membrane protein [Echinicola pacifica]
MYWNNYIKAFLMLLLVLSSTGLMAQERSISGTVSDSNSGETIPGVNILIEGKNKGTVTDLEGNFTLQAQAGDVLVFSYIGYTSQKIPLSNESKLEVSLKLDSKQLDEIVVIGYGEQSRETLTSSVAKLDNKVLENVPFANAASALKGTVSGVRVQTTTGQPGAAPRIIVRGGTSINNPDGAQPLYIIDGVIRNNMDDVNADDIESLQVLKDAAATAIYGARGANGVVIITTKTGKVGKTLVTYRFNIGASELWNRYDMGSARDYIYFNRKGILATGEKHPDHLFRLNLASGFGTGNDLTNSTAFSPQYLSPENEHKLNEGWQQMPDPADPSKTILFSDTDWQDVLFRTAVSQNHYINISGGSEKARYDLGVGYLDNKGVAINTDFKRFTTRMNGDIQVNDKLGVYGRMNFTSSSNSQVFSENQLFQRALGLPPTAKLYYEDGTLASGQNKTQGNPLYHLNRIDALNATNRITLSGGANWEIFKDFTFEPMASLYFVQGTTNSFQKSYYNTPTQFIDSRDASASNSIYWQKQFDGVFSYQKYIGQHNLQFKVGGSYYDRKSYSASASGRGAASDLIPTLNASSEPTSVSSSLSQQVIVGYFGRVNYDFDKKYLFSFTTRYDGASSLGSNNYWGFFPGLSAGWNLHREDFWGNMPEDITSLKLRASYGVNGNIGNLSDFHAQGLYSVGNRYNDQAAIQNNRMANQDLQWERSGTFDIGMDLGLFDSRVTVIADYYNRLTDNLLTSLELPQSTGFNSILTNLGSLRNEGVEMEVTASVIQGQKFGWNVSANASYNINTVVELPENDNDNNRIGGIFVYDQGLGIYVWKGGLQEGGQLGDMFAYQQLGVYATDQEAAEGAYDALVPGTDKSKFGGDVNWADLDKNDSIDSRDRVYAGNIYPKWTGGFTNTLNYKSLSLTLRTDFALGHTIYHETRARFNGQYQGDIGILQETTTSWQNQGDMTQIPRYYWADQLSQNNSFRGNTYYYEKGDYLAIREVTLSYNLPKKWVSALKIANVRTYFTGSNLFYFTQYTGLNPEEGGTDSGRYPIARNFLFGVNVNF